MSFDQLEQLHDLCQKHLEYTLQENWGPWERVAVEKEGLYQRLSAEGLRPGPYVKGMLDHIGKLEARTMAALRNSRSKIGRELQRIRQGRQALRGYGPNRRPGGGRHFGIKC